MVDGASKVLPPSSTVVQGEAYAVARVCRKLVAPADVTADKLLQFLSVQASGVVFEHSAALTGRSPSGCLRSLSLRTLSFFFCQARPHQVSASQVEPRGRVAA